MKKGDTIYTPRFCSVIIADVLDADEARAQGYTEPPITTKTPIITFTASTQAQTA